MTTTSPLKLKNALTIVCISLLTTAAMIRSASRAYAGDLLVASFATGSILQYNQTTGSFVTAFVPPGAGGLASAGGVVLGPDGNLYVTGGTPPASSVLRYNGTTGAFMGAFVPAGLGGLDDATYLRFGPDGNLYLSDYSAGNVKRYNGSTGAFMGVFTSGYSMYAPQGLLFGPDGNLYVADEMNVLRFDGATGAFMGVFVAAGSGGLSVPVGLTFGPDGNLYVSATYVGEVLRYNGATGAFINAFVPAGSGGLGNPHGLVFGPDGNLYVADSLYSQVLRYSGTTGSFIDVFVPSGSGGLSIATALIFSNLTSSGFGNLNFGEQPLGTTSAARLETIYNPGPGILTVINETITGADPLDFPIPQQCEGGLSPGKSCVVKVEFAPLALGARSATLNVNFLGFPTETAALTGTGVARPSLSASIVSQSQVGTTLTATLALTNTGTVDIENVVISQISAETLAGTGTVTLTSPLPLDVGYIGVRVTAYEYPTFNVPSTVTKFSVTESGTMQASGASLTFSFQQVVFPSGQ